VPRGDIGLILDRSRHEYAGAMNSYLNYLKAEEMEKDETHAEYAPGGVSKSRFPKGVASGLESRL
jgi:hypothetical protein